jgi:hypothetical protein
VSEVVDDARKNFTSECPLVVMRRDPIPLKGLVREQLHKEMQKKSDHGFVSMRLRSFAVSCLMSEVTRCLAR